MNRGLRSWPVGDYSARLVARPYRVRADWMQLTAEWATQCPD